MSFRKRIISLEIILFFSLFIFGIHFFSFLSLIKYSFAATCNGSCHIKGTVKNQNGSGISGATVKANGGNVVQTNGAGDYAILGLNPGNYSVTYSGPPSGNAMIFPTNNPPTWNVKIGNSSTCSTGGAPNPANCGNDGSVNEIDFKFQPQPNCSNTLSCGVCSGAPANTCNNGNGTQSCTYTGPAPCNQVGAPDQSCTINACIANYTCTGGKCVANNSNISGNLFNDYNNNGIQDGNDNKYKFGNVTAVRTSDGLTLNGSSNGSGGYSITNAPNGTYTVTFAAPANYARAPNNPQTVTINNANVTNINLGVVPLLSISGTIFTDTNGDGSLSGGESAYTQNSLTITLIGPTNKTLNTSTGTYTTNLQLLPGNYTVSFTGLPAGYFMTMPINGPPPSFAVIVGPSCTGGNSPDAGCDGNNNITNLNFGIVNATSWVQSVCGDIRIDNGLNDPIPASPSCGGAPPAPYAITSNATCNNTPGILYSGNTNAPTALGQGQASANPYNFAAGGISYPEKFTPATTNIIKTSYNYFLSRATTAGITPTPLDPFCISGTINNCTLKPNLPHGLYIANGPLNLKGYPFPPTSNYVILVNGNLHIQGNLTLPATSTLTISSNNDIHVDSNVGSPATTTTGNIEGFFSADDSFIVDTTATCNTEQRLNIEGSVVVNAAYKPTPGTFQNLRDLCHNNASCPTISFIQRPDFILNAPPFIKHSSSLLQEIAP